MDQSIEAMTKQINVRKKDTYFVTHGLGSITALKYIEMIDQPIEGFFSIAGFKEDAENIDLDIDLSNVTIDYDNIKKKVDNFYGLSSKNDKYVSYKETQRLMNALEGNLRIVEDGGHFLEEDGFETFTALQDRMQDYMTR